MADSNNNRRGGIVKFIAIGGLLALVFFGVKKAKEISRLFYVKVMNLRDFGTSGSSLFGEIKFTVDIEFTNPEKFSVSAEIKQVIILFNKKQIGLSNPNSQSLLIAPQTKSVYEGLSFALPYTSLMSAGILNEFLAKGKKALDLIEFEVHASVNSIPFTTIVKLT